MITKEQLWYVCNVYPEPVSQDEAKEIYIEMIASDDDSYWISAANVINQLSTKE